MELDRDVLLRDETVTGAAWCARHSALVDQWLAGVLDDALGPSVDGIALVAVGGYGRGELCPLSDLDVMLLHADRRDINELAPRVWYPLWDGGFKLGHSVSTLKQALALAADDLDTATALVDARHVAGDATLTARLREAAIDQWRRDSRRRLDDLAARVDARHSQSGEVAFMLEPDLKEGRGGLRDVHSLRWAHTAGALLLELDDIAITQAYTVLLDARVELHRRTRRAANVLTLQDQDAVAAALGRADADELMADIAGAARLIAWTSDDAWRRIRSAPKRRFGRPARRDRPLDGDLALQDGEVVVTASGAAAGDGVLALRAARRAAEHATVIARASLEDLAATTRPLGEPWPAEARAELIALLLTGAAAIPVIEALDQRGVWTRILPEWEAVRSRPQHSSYHRFTVDRHLLEAVANAAALSERVARADILVMAALLHDLGKGRGEDHTQIGVELARTIATRVGFPPDDVALLVELVANHLLLSEAAARRDLDDPATARRAADRVSSLDALALLAALTEADSRATGPAAWGPAKAQLVATLVELVEQVLRGKQLGAAPSSFPDTARLAALAAPGTTIETSRDTLVLMTDDRPGVFSKIAGVLALHGLDVVAAFAHSTDTGRALSEFRVVDRFRDEPPWARVERDLTAALEGRLALSARVAERAHKYERRHLVARRAAEVTVRFEQDLSDSATIIDVHAPDGEGVLYRITRALTEFDLDIRSAHVQTLGHRVADAFYVVDRAGRKVTEPATLQEIERAIVHALR